MTGPRVLVTGASGYLGRQTIARLADRVNFYDAILEQDGHDLHKIIPPRDLSSWRNLPVGSLANTKPIAITSLQPDHVREVLKRHPYRSFPVILQNVVRGVVTRAELQHALVRGVEPVIENAVLCRANQTLAEIEPHLINSPAGLFLVTQRDQGPVTGLFTLHDLLRAQVALLD